MALSDLGDTEGFDKGREEDQLYAFELSDGVYKRKKITTQEEGGAQKLGDVVDVSWAVPSGGSNEYPQSMFLSRNMKKYQRFYLKISVLGSEIFYIFE